MSKKLMLLFGCTLFVMALVAGPAHAGGLPSPQTGVPALDTQSLLPLPALTAGSCAKAEPAATPLPDFMEPSRRLGYCHCGCSSVRTCHTSDDCGGASCDQVISCC